MPKMEPKMIRLIPEIKFEAVFIAISKFQICSDPAPNRGIVPKMEPKIPEVKFKAVLRAISKFRVYPKDEGLILTVRTPKLKEMDQEFILSSTSQVRPTPACVLGFGRSSRLNDQSFPIT